MKTAYLCETELFEVEQFFYDKMRLFEMELFSRFKLYLH